jgi:hypothetical protein
MPTTNNPIVERSSFGLSTIATSDSCSCPGQAIDPTLQAYISQYSLSISRYVYPYFLSRYSPLDVPVRVAELLSVNLFALYESQNEFTP